MIVDLAETYRDTDLGREAEALLAPCVQCGQCTFTCPTFRLLGDEWDGPRGRIWLIRQFLQGKDPDPNSIPPAYVLASLQGRTLGQNVQRHLDRCLTCRSCETSCPKGVHYGRLLDIGRELVEREVPRPLGERLLRRTVRAIVPHPGRFRGLLRIGQTLRPLLPVTLRERVPLPRRAGDWPQREHARRMLVWQGCVQPSLAPDINAAAARVLDRFGIRLEPAGAGCCGAMSHHLAATDEALGLMRRTIDTLWPQIESGIEAIVLTASGCGTHFRDYGELLRDDPAYRDKARRVSELTRDIAEVVADAWSEDGGPVLPALVPPQRIAFQSSCSLQHGARLNGVAEGLLKRAGYRLATVQYPFLCCGAAGTYSILQRPLSVALRTEKLKTLLASRPVAIATANIGCLTHLAAASPVPVRHWVEWLDQRFAAAQAPVRDREHAPRPVGD
jgi:glycolate oxidase iron-sulfur subunit